MARVYSTELLAIAGLLGTVAYTAPSDSVVILRDLDAYWGGGASANVSVRLIGSRGQTLWEEHVNASTPPYDSQTWQWQGRQVIEPGESFSIRATGQPCDVTVSGYVLGP